MGNPVNASGFYALAWTSAFTSFWGNFSEFTTRDLLTPISQSFGSGIMRQAQPVRYNTNTDILEHFGTPNTDRNTNQFIGSTVNAISGSLGITGNTTTGNLMVTISSDTTGEWRIYGDVTELTGTVDANTSTLTTIHLTDTYGTKNVFLQLYTGADFASHYAYTTQYTLEADCASRWNNDNFIDASFRAHNPTPGNIICALYGSGENGSDPTAYTQNRSGTFFNSSNDVPTPVTFTKANYADRTQPANQDCITSNVCITRANSNGIFNKVSESVYNDGVSPTDTEWSYGICADKDTLTFTNWINAIGTPPAMPGQNLCLHLITDNRYYDVMFSSWTK